TRCANSLVACGILTLDDLRAATDHELMLIPQIGTQGLRAVCELVGRDVPSGAATRKEIQAEYVRVWRAKVGAERFEYILDLIVDMAGDILDRPSVNGGQALWSAARQRRAQLGRKLATTRKEKDNGRSALASSSSVRRTNMANLLTAPVLPPVS